MTEPVTRERVAPHVDLVTFNRPEARNAVNAAVAARLASIVAETEADSDVWAVILTGAGGAAFSAGADLREVAQGGMDALYTFGGGFAGFVEARRSKPWIAAVEGYALAGGFEIVLACDLVVAAEHSSFGLPEVSRGLVAAAGGVYRLARVLPRAIAFELIVTASRLEAKSALELGLLNRLCAPGDAVRIAKELCASLCANAPLAVRESLYIARKALDLSDGDLMRLSIDAQQRLARTEDFTEGPRAFLERRTPQWRGC